MILTVLLDTVHKVKEFTDTVAHFPGEADLRSGRYVINAKSTLGVFSLELSKPLELELYGEPDEVLLKQLKQYCV